MCSNQPKFTEKDIPDLSGYVAIVTGGKSLLLIYSSSNRPILIKQVTPESATKPPANSPSATPACTSPPAPRSASPKPSPK